MVTIYLTMGLFCAIIGGLIGSGKGKGGAGFVLGALLGILGVIIIAILEPTPEVQAQRNLRVQQLMGQQGSEVSPGAWWPDPYQRHQSRYWDGTRWTDHVADRGVTSTDSIGGTPI